MHSVMIGLGRHDPCANTKEEIKRRFDEYEIGFDTAMNQLRALGMFERQADDYLIPMASVQS